MPKTKFKTEIADDGVEVCTICGWDVDDFEPEEDHVEHHRSLRAFVKRAAADTRKSKKNKKS